VGLVVVEVKLGFLESDFGPPLFVVCWSCGFLGDLLALSAASGGPFGVVLLLILSCLYIGPLCGDCFVRGEADL